ncbi:MAG: aspartate aminotransferase family protein [Ferrimonas sp.]
MMMPSSITRALFDEVMVPNYNPSAMIPVRGQGSRVWDQQGNEYIDFSAGIAVNSLGHGHPQLNQALTEQAQSLWHVSNIFTNEPALKLAQTLVDSTFAERVYFANSGAEANEAALKLARRVAVNRAGTDKTQIIAFDNGFHGRTFFTVSVGGQAAYSDGFGPKPAGITHLPFNDLVAFEQAISERTCAVIMEPLQGEGGIVPATHEFIAGVRALCHQYQALLIFDEVQTGVGRTGHFYAYQHFGVVPDVLTTAKGLGGGFPIAAMLTTAELAEHLNFGSHGSTYGGNPLGCAVAQVVVDTLKQPMALANVQARSQQLRAGLERIGQRYGIFSEIRGMGLLLGAVLAPAYAGRARDFWESATEAGLMCLVAGSQVLRFTPSLLITHADLELGLQRLELAVQQVVNAANAPRK